MRDTEVHAAPMVLPAGQNILTPADEKWLTGGRRLHAVLAIVLLLLIALPVMIIEQGRLVDDWSSDDLFVGNQVPEPSGVYWRWSEPANPTSVFSEGDGGSKLSQAVIRWFAALLPAIAAILVLISLRLRGTGRMLLLVSAGFLLAEEVWYDLPGVADLIFIFDSDMWSVISYSFADDVHLGGSGLLLLLLGVFYGGGKCRFGAVMRLAALILVLFLILDVGFFIVGVCIERTPESFFDPYFLDTLDFSKLLVGEWIAIGFVVLARMAELALAVFGILVAAGGDRRVMRAGFLAAAVLLGCEIAIQVAKGAQVGHFIWTESAGRWDRLLHGGVLVHRLLPQVIGFVLIAAGLGRLTTAVCVGRALRGGTSDLSCPPTSSAPDDCEQKP